MRSRRIVALAAGALASLSLAASAAAAPFTVTRFDDPVPDACAVGDCSLREAIQAANGAAGADSIALGPGTYQLSQVGTSEDAALDGDLDITDDLTITGAGMEQTTIDGGGVVTLERVFQFDPVTGGTAPRIAFSDLTITDGTGSFGAGIRANNESVSELSRVSLSGNDGDSFGGAMFNEDDAQMTIRDSLIEANSLTGSFAGGVMNQNNAVMTIERTTIRRNDSPGGFGGGVMNQNEGQLTIRDSVISENSNGGRGGGLFLQNDSVTVIENSSVIDNTSDRPGPDTAEVGGGLAIQNEASVSLVNSTVSGNSADDAGGGIHLQNAPTVTLRGVTVTANEADADLSGEAAPADVGGGVFVDPLGTPSLTLGGTIIAANQNAGAPDCFGTVGSAGFNLIGDAGGCTFANGSGDLVGIAGAPIDPQLGPLADNGGPTLTHLPAASSPAVDAATASGLTRDQRGQARPVDLAKPNAAGSDGTDMGSVELAAPPPVTATPDPGVCRGVTAAKQTGTGAVDVLTGSAGIDQLLGGGGDDRLDAVGGDDCADGGDGDDLLKGGEGKDAVRGQGGDDRLKGQAGVDALKGGPGADRLAAGPGRDKISGGGGNDVINAADGARDKVRCGGGKKDEAAVDEEDRLSRSCERVKTAR